MANRNGVANAIETSAMDGRLIILHKNKSFSIDVKIEELGLLLKTELEFDQLPDPVKQIHDTSLFYFCQFAAYVMKLTYQSRPTDTTPLFEAVEKVFNQMGKAHDTNMSNRDWLNLYEQFMELDKDIWLDVYAGLRDRKAYMAIESKPPQELTSEEREQALDPKATSVESD